MQVQKKIGIIHRLWVPAFLFAAYFIGFALNIAHSSKTLTIYMIVVFFLLLLSIYPCFIYKNVNPKLFRLIFDRIDTAWLMFVPLIVLIALDVQDPVDILTYFSSTMLCFGIWIFLGLDSLEKRPNWLIFSGALIAILVAMVNIYFGLNDKSRNDPLSSHLDSKITTGRVRRTLFTSFFILAIRSLGVATYNLFTGRHLLLFVRARGFRPKMIIGNKASEIENPEKFSPSSDENILSYLFFQSMEQFSPSIGVSRSVGSVEMVEIAHDWSKAEVSM